MAYKTFLEKIPGQYRGFGTSMFGQRPMEFMEMFYMNFDNNFIIIADNKLIIFVESARKFYNFE
jgi:hypothetical protein